MPTYEYSCSHCLRDFVVQARMSDPAPIRGKDCASEDCCLKKKLSRTFGYVAGSAPAPLPSKAPATPSPTAAESAAHICSKYCDQH